MISILFAIPSAGIAKSVSSVDSIKPAMLSANAITRHGVYNGKPIQVIPVPPICFPAAAGIESNIHPPEKNWLKRDPQ
jgi:hypothetical protein